MKRDQCKGFYEIMMFRYEFRYEIMILSFAVGALKLVRSRWVGGVFER